MNTQTTQPIHEAIKPMATGRQLEKKRQHWQRMARKALERSYEEAVRAMVRATRVPEGYQRVTWTVNDGVIYLGIAKLAVPKDPRDAWRHRGETPGTSRRRDVEAPFESFTWIEAGPLPDPKAVMRASANDPWYRELQRLAA